jgi:hypothetical protein
MSDPNRIRIVVYHARWVPKEREWKELGLVGSSIYGSIRNRLPTSRVGSLVTDVDGVFKVGIVHLILSHDAEEAIRSLAERYDVDAPSFRVGLPKGRINVAGCYVVEKETIYVASSDELADPFLILHEFYHHLRSVSGRHRGTEKYADRFAREYLNEYARRARVSG